MLNTERDLRRDYPEVIVPIDHIEPVPRRIRAVLAGEVVLDTIRAQYVWESPNYPQYYIPVADVNPLLLVDEKATAQGRNGTAQLHGLRVGGTNRPRSVRILAPEAPSGLAGTARFNWDALDAWYEEDEEVFVHPRNPYTRVDALRSTRHVRVEAGGTVLAEVIITGHGFRDGSADEVLPESNRGALRAPDSKRHGHGLPVQGTNQWLLVTAHRRSDAARGGVDLRLPDAPTPPHRRAHRLLQREGRHPCRRHPPPPTDDAIFQVTRTTAQSDPASRDWLWCESCTP